MAKFIKKRFQGRSTHRFQENPLERVFAEHWQEIHDSGTKILNYSVSSDPNVPTQPTHDQDLLAATLMQWLGSPVGQNFLLSVLMEDAATDLRGELVEWMQDA